ncbi:MAG: hypothetical protein IJX38_04965 [Clostridia bacterium]|nr:hypothetical protein [Clostridia bacterium]
MAEIELSLLNEMYRRSPEGCVALAEEKYHKSISEIASYVLAHGDVRLLMIAGPSGSGKTTTANLLRDAIERGGERAMVVSLDDFYRDGTDPEYPRHADGTRDYERPEALRLDEVAHVMQRIAAGESFELPRYDFKVAARVGMRRVDDMHDGCVIIEGLHALNPIISATVPRDRCYRLFISLSTNINDGGERLISGRKMRFMRRMVRDGLYRGADAERTLEMWRGVLAAEDIYLYPYRDTADISLDTFHSFEVGVMRPFVLGMISDDLALRDPYAAEVLRAARSVASLDESLVPDNSLIREFIPGGIYEHLY